MVRFWKPGLSELKWWGVCSPQPWPLARSSHSLCCVFWCKERLRNILLLGRNTGDTPSIFPRPPGLKNYRFHGDLFSLLSSAYHITVAYASPHILASSLNHHGRRPLQLSSTLRIYAGLCLNSPDNTYFASPQVHNLVFLPIGHIPLDFLLCAGLCRRIMGSVQGVLHNFQFRSTFPKSCRLAWEDTIKHIRVIMCKPSSS